MVFLEVVTMEGSLAGRISGKDTIGQHFSSLPDEKNHFRPKVQIPQVSHLEIQSQQMGLGIDICFYKFFRSVL